LLHPRAHLGMLKAERAVARLRAHEEHVMTQRGQDSSEAPDITSGAETGRGTGAGDAASQDEKREGMGGPANTWGTSEATSGSGQESPHDQPVEGGLEQAGQGGGAEGGNPSEV
jgi:hypothetical protein